MPAAGKAARCSGAGARACGPGGGSSSGLDRGAGCHCHEVVGKFPRLPVVGHQHDGDLSAERGDGTADRGGRFPVQVGGGFIEEQHTGSGLDPGEAARQCDAAQLPRAEFGGMFRGEVLRGALCQATQGRRLTRAGRSVPTPRCPLFPGR